MILLTLLGCSSASLFSEGIYSFSISEIELQGEIEVQDSWSGQEICLEIYSPFLRTKDCEKAELTESVKGGAWFSIPIETILGSGKLALRWQGNDLFFPLGVRVGEYDFSTEVLSSPLNNESKTQIEEKFLQHQKDWNIGEFVLLQENEIKGAIEFQAEQGAKVFIFDQFWLTPEVEISEEGVDGSEFVLQFLAEPNFDEDELAILRIHPFFFQAVVPMGELPSSAEKKYQLKAGIPEYSILEKKKNQAILKAEQAEKAWIKQESQLLLKPLGDQSSCEKWNKTKEMEMIWIGYDIDTKWDGQGCSLLIETEFEQHRRRFSGEIKRE